MSVNFSTIRPMDPSTVSRKPTYTTETETPAASTPIGAEPKKKSSHGFAKTLLTVVVLAGAAAILRKKVDMFKDFTKPVLAEGAKVTDTIMHYGKMGLYYGKQAVAAVGDYVNKYYDVAAKWVKETISAKPKTPEV